MSEVPLLTLSRLSLSSGCGMLADGRRLCDCGGLRPCDVDMVGSRDSKSYSTVKIWQVAWSRGRVRDVFFRE
jgi:hypothetical protein